MMINNKRGLTLIEVIVAVALVAVAALLMYSFFGQGFSLYTKGTESADEQMNLRQPMSDITNKVRVTKADNIAVSGGVLSVGSVDYSLKNGSILRGDAVIATAISTFDVSINSGMMSIRIVNEKGTALETSLSLLQP